MSVPIALQDSNFWFLPKLATIFFGIIIFSVLRSLRTTKLIDSGDLVKIGAAVGGFISSVTLFFRSITSSEVRQILSEDTFSLCLGALALALASIDEDLKKDCLYIWSKVGKKTIPSAQPPQNKNVTPPSP